MRNAIKKAAHVIEIDINGAIVSEVTQRVAKPKSAPAGLETKIPSSPFREELP